MEQDYYEVLGVSRDADAGEIRSAFKRLALTHHPDKVVEADRPEAEVRFKVISEAYEVLSNEESRIMYDAEAEFGAQFGGGAQDWQDFYYAESEPMPDFFEFATGPDPRRQSSGRRTADALFEVELNLEDVYVGRMIKLRTQRKVLCRRCQGSGGRPKAKKHRCQTCKGFGTTKKTHLVGPDLLATSTVRCDVCHGFGEIYRDRDLCRRCKGDRRQEMNTMIEVYVPKGVKNRHRIVLEGQADEEPGKATGDLVIVVHVDNTHPVFRREGADLYASAAISLAESLTGFSRPLVTHLDGRELKPTIPRGQIVPPNSVLKIPGEGLVIEEGATDGRDDGFTGDLYLQIAVEYPTDIEPHILDKVARLLRTPDDANTSDDTLSNSNDDLNEKPEGRPEGRLDDDGKPGSPLDEMISPVEVELMDEYSLPEYELDANDEPEIEPVGEEPAYETHTSAAPYLGCTIV